VKAINRGLIDAALITMKDSPNGKRYGVRDHQGRIVEAYGFDLSSIATRHEEFVRLAAEAKAERALIGRLRRRPTIARKAITQSLETVAEYGFGDAEWSQLRHETQTLVKSLRLVERPEELAIGVGGLERRQAAALTRLEQLLNTVNPDLKGAENRPHITPTNPVDYHLDDTVMAHRGCRSASGPVAFDPVPDAGQQKKEAAQDRLQSESHRGLAIEPEPVSERRERPSTTPPPGRTDTGTVLRLSINELTTLAPRLRIYLKSPRPAWPEIIDAADRLRGELGVSKSTGCGFWR
jgi:replication initiation protein RepC